jgi:hypothetical protein
MPRRRRTPRVRFNDAYPSIEVVFSPDLLERCRQTFMPVSEGPLSDQDCQEVLNGLVRYISLLARWDAESKAEKREAESASGPRETLPLRPEPD